MRQSCMYPSISGRTSLKGKAAAAASRSVAVRTLEAFAMHWPSTPLSLTSSDVLVAAPARRGRSEGGGTSTTSYDTWTGAKCRGKYRGGSSMISYDLQCMLHR